MSTCKECIFYESKTYECRRRAPVVVMVHESAAMMGSRWPGVHPEHWCGEFEALKELEKKEENK